MEPYNISADRVIVIPVIISSLLFFNISSIIFKLSEKTDKQWVKIIIACDNQD
jgi:hypothetical protein